jgi:Na+-translocating ferredoxin:NAD+ oxidoreductase RnfC subunit
VPRQVSILLKQHAGVPAAPVVQVGDCVKRGQLIADIPDGALGARVHASIDGNVTQVGKTAIEIRDGRNPS